MAVPNIWAMGVLWPTFSSFHLDCHLSWRSDELDFVEKKLRFFFHLPLQSVNRYKVLSCHKLRSAIHLLQSFHMCIDRHFPGDHLALDGSEWVNWTCRMHMPWAIYRNRYVMLNLQKMVWYHSPKGWKFMDYAIVCSIRMTLKKIIILS